MRNSLFNPPSGYVMLGKIFRNNMSPGIMRQYSQMKASNPVKSLLLGNFNMSNKPALEFSNKKIISYYSKRFSSSVPKLTSLMDFHIETHPSFFYVFKILYQRFVVFQSIKEEFCLNEFMENSGLALEVVTKLLSDLKFDELKGLMTDECREEVERNVRALEPNKRYELAIKAKDITAIFITNLEVIKGEENNEKIFVQIKVAYQILKTIEESNRSFDPKPFEVFKNSLVYNCRFIKEFTSGVSDQWTINAINVVLMSEILQPK